MAKRSALNFPELRLQLMRIEKTQILENEVANDPLSLVLKYDHSPDREVVAFITCAFAYGNVKQIIKSVEKILTLLGPSPAQKLIKTSAGEWLEIIPRSFKHRFNTADDLGLLLTWLGIALKESGSLENFFMESSKAETPENLTLSTMLENFIKRMTDLSTGPYKKPKSKGVLFFFPKPSDKSGCKRLLLFMKWVSGTGPMTLGLWSKFPPEKLIIPVDTHILRISKNLGLTKRKDASWKTAEEITHALRNISPEDPTRYDFALCHLGISQSCPSKFKIEVCLNCQMNVLCLNYSLRNKKSGARTSVKKLSFFQKKTIQL